MNLDTLRLLADPRNRDLLGAALMLLIAFGCFLGALIIDGPGSWRALTAWARDLLPPQDAAQASADAIAARRQLKYRPTSLTAPAAKGFERRMVIDLDEARRRKRLGIAATSFSEPPQRAS